MEVKQQEKRSDGNPVARAAHQAVLLANE